MTPGWLQRVAAIALTSFAVLFFEITVTRILSVVLWYHWAFLSISLAMLKISASVPPSKPSTSPRPRSETTSRAGLLRLPPDRRLRSEPESRR